MGEVDTPEVGRIARGFPQTLRGKESRRLGAVPQLVHPSSDVGSGVGARSATRAAALGRLLARTSEASGERLRAAGLASGATPEFMSKRNCELIGNRGRTADQVARLELGDERLCRRCRNCSSRKPGLSAFTSTAENLTTASCCWTKYLGAIVSSTKSYGAGGRRDQTGITWLPHKVGATYDEG